MLTLQNKKRGLSERTLGDGHDHRDGDAADGLGRAERLTMTAGDLHKFFVQGGASRSAVKTDAPAT
jgi:hypothetical protein